MPQINSYQAKDSELHPNQSPYLWPPVLEHTGDIQEEARHKHPDSRKELTVLCPRAIGAPNPLLPPFP